MQFFDSSSTATISIASTFRSLYYTSIVKQTCRLLHCYLCFLPMSHTSIFNIKRIKLGFRQYFPTPPFLKFLLDQQEFLLGRRTPCYQLGGTRQERAILLLPQQENTPRGVEKQQENSKVFLDSCIFLLIVRRTQQENSISGSRCIQSDVQEETDEK